jgi:hypothetical protein
MEEKRDRKKGLRHAGSAFVPPGLDGENTACPGHIPRGLMYGRSTATQTKKFTLHRRRWLGRVFSGDSEAGLA